MISSILLYGILVFLNYYAIDSFLIVQTNNSKLQEFKIIHYKPDLNNEDEAVSPHTIVYPSIFPQYIPPYINFSLYTDPKRFLPQEVRKSLIWIRSLHAVNRVIRNTGLRLVKSGSFDSDSHSNWIGFFSGRVSKRREPRAVLKHAYQKYNILPGAEELCHKDKMWYNIQRLAKKFGNAEDFGFVLETYSLPGEIFQFLKRLTFHCCPTSEEKGMAGMESWLYKPARASHSNGFVLFQSADQLSKILGPTKAIVQSFMSSPYGGRFIRYRLYVLQTGFHPLRVFIYNKGDCILKKTPTSSLDVVVESNELLNLLKKQEGHDPIKLQTRMEDAILKTIFSAENKMAEKSASQLQNSYNAYQHWSVDFMFDELGIPWLTEFNRYISLGIVHDVEATVKIPMLTETLNVAGYHFPPTMSAEGRKFLSFGNNTGNTVFDEIMYSFERSGKMTARAEVFSDIFYNAKGNPIAYRTKILKDLQPEDIRQLMIAEDELSRTRNYKRIFPTSITHKYLRFLETSDPYPYMLQDAWESTHGQNRALGISFLKRHMTGERTGYRLRAKDNLVNKMLHGSPL